MRLKWVSSFGKITPCSPTPNRTAACPDSTHGVGNRQRVLHPTFKGVWSTVVNFALWPPPDTKPGQYPQPHKRSDDSLGRHALGGWAYCPQRSVRVSLA